MKKITENFNIVALQSCFSSANVVHFINAYIIIIIIVIIIAMPATFKYN